MKFTLFTNSGNSLGLGCRLARDGHDVVLCIFRDAISDKIGSGLMKTEAGVRPDLRGILPHVSDSDVVIFDSHEHSGLAKALAEHGKRVFGAFYQSRPAPPLPDRCAIKGALSRGSKIVLEFEGGIVTKQNSFSIEGCMLKLARTSRPSGMENCMETFFFDENGKLAWYTQDILPSVMASVLELVEGDASELFVVNRGAVLAERSTGMAVAIDPEIDTECFLSVNSSASKHLYGVSCALSDGERLNALTNDTIAYSCAWGVDGNEAGRRAYRTIERVRAGSVRTRGKMPDLLASFMHF